VKPEEDSNALVGITHYAQDQLGDVVYLDLPGAGARLEQFAKLGEIESVKAVSDLFSPVSGEVVDVNQEAVDHPELVNEDPSGRGWLLRVRLQDAAELENLLSAGEYSAFLEETSH
jgi:glycine cleavage system H protein